MAADLCGHGDILCAGGVDTRPAQRNFAPMEQLYDLNDRDGLPDNLKLLLEAFPREEWSANPYFAGLVQFWLERHDMFRQLCQMLNADAEAAMDGKMSAEMMAPRLSRFGSGLVQGLHGHHQIEDMHYFPVLKTREAPLERGFDILDRDHHAMDGLLQRFADAANGVLRQQLEVGRFREELLSFQTLLERHLWDEEDLIMPVILKHGPGGIE